MEYMTRRGKSYFGLSQLILTSHFSLEKDVFDELLFQQFDGIKNGNLVLTFRTAFPKAFI